MFNSYVLTISSLNWKYRQKNAHIQHTSVEVVEVVLEPPPSPPPLPPLPSLHLLSCFCHQDLLLHLNNKVAEPLTLPHTRPSEVLSVILWPLRAESLHPPHQPPGYPPSNWPYEQPGMQQSFCLLPGENIELWIFLYPGLLKLYFSIVCA